MWEHLDRCLSSESKGLIKTGRVERVLWDEVLWELAGWLKSNPTDGYTGGDFMRDLKNL